MAATLTSVLKMNLTGLGFDPDIWYRYAHATAPAELEHGYLQITAGTSIQLPLGQIAVTALFWVVLIARAQTIYVKFDSAGTGNDLDPAADAQILIPWDTSVCTVFSTSAMIMLAFINRYTMIKLKTVCTVFST